LQGKKKLSKQTRKGGVFLNGIEIGKGGEICQMEKWAA